MAARNGRALCLVYFDLDDFKDINDTQGHERGDVVLTGVAECLRMVSRNVDFVFRLGGDEFCVLLTESTEALARNVYCVRLAELVEQRLDGLRDGNTSIQTFIKEETTFSWQSIFKRINQCE